MNPIEEFEQQKTKVLKYILYQKRTEYEVRQKFSRTIDENMLEDIIEYLKEAKYINDQEYIKRAIHNFMLLKNLSIKEIQYKLLSKGLYKKDIENYLAKNQEELQQYEMKSIQNIFDKKSATMQPEEIKPYLLKKGYPSENIKKVLEEH